jgi:heat shock protein HtpX
MNNVKVFGLMALLTALFASVGAAIGGSGGAVIALLLAGVMNLLAYWNSARMVLRMYGAQVSPESAPWLYEMVDRLRQRAGLPMPIVAVAPHAQPNAFATGRNPRNAVVCVTEGLVGLVTLEELEGVIAHELAHIKNRDMLLQTFTATLAGAVSSLGQMAMWGSLFGGGDDEDGGGGLVMALVAPIAAALVQMAISRQREFKADAVGAEICGRPLALAGALRKLDEYAHRIPMQVSPAVAPLAQVNPLSAFGGGMARMFSTHPPTEDRVRRLEQLARAA